MKEEEGEGSFQRASDGPDSTSTGLYILRPVVQDIPLSSDEHTPEAQITCVELCEENLYIGTSQAEILHFVAIPADSFDEISAPQYIFASRLQPSYNTQAANASRILPGIQQILVLPKVQKACILCNGTLSFYSLPELSPAFGNTNVPNCTWVGGVDLNNEGAAGENGVVVMICVRNKTRLVRISDEARRVRDIEFPGCLISARRGTFACVADARSYALLDIENQQKIPLFPISSLDENIGGGRVENMSSAADSTSSSSRPISSEAGSSGRGHARSTSLGAFVGGLGRRQGSPHSRSRDRSGLAIPASPTRDLSPSPSSHNRNMSTPDTIASMDTGTEKPLPTIPARSDSLRGHSPNPVQPEVALKPHICSPTPTEFLLTTGTTAGEPGVGIFVNLDGDVVRGTLQFEQYPHAVIIDGCGVESEFIDSSEDREGFVLATMRQPSSDGDRGVVEIQRWDTDNGGPKQWIEIPRTLPAGIDGGVDMDRSRSDHFGLRTTNSIASIPMRRIGDLLRGRRLRLSTESQLQESALEDWEISRDQEEADFGRRLKGRVSRHVLWSGSSVWWIMRNPLVMRLDAMINEAMPNIKETSTYAEVDRTHIIQVVNSIREQEAVSETEFLSLEYIRQKASVILFADLLARPSSLPSIQAADLRITGDLLMEGGVDPRVVLALIPLLRNEVVEGSKGIWIHSGLIPIVERYRMMTSESFEKMATPDTLNLIKRYLGTWRQRKGFGSVADEVEVFQTVDAALLLILLEQDGKDSLRTSKPSPTRAELYALVDSGMDCFDHAIEMLEQYHRLFVLSRLYQSRRLGRKVLETWQRIIEGERDDGGGLTDGENEVRRYLVNIKDTGLVDEFGTWLARRNPALGVQVFTNDSSRVKWEPHQVVMLLRRRAPDAVKFYLEHLVFGKKTVKYANDLISHYLDSVLTVLASSPSSRLILATSYESYRALRPPKPTYRQFITENTAPFPWWHDRLRLLELIGGSHGTDFSYDVSSIQARIEPFEQSLVPESIILDGRQGRHQQALRLLIHGLGDYHTAVNYCLLGGASIFHPATPGSAARAAPEREEQAVLFAYLLVEFLRIEDEADRLQRTGELLERFGSWYDVREVLELVPEDWSVEVVSGFLVSAFRRLVQERNEAAVTRALSGAENLQIAAAFVEKCGALGPQLENVS